jgi:hypothetical protein
MFHLGGKRHSRNSETFRGWTVCFPYRTVLDHQLKYGNSNVILIDLLCSKDVFENAMSLR